MLASLRIAGHQMEEPQVVNGQVLGDLKEGMLQADEEKGGNM